MTYYYVLQFPQINLEKKVETWWKHVLEGEPDIDQKSIDNTQHLHEMDEESQTDYRRVMHDFEQKRQGKPTSKELVCDIFILYLAAVCIYSILHFDTSSLVWHISGLAHLKF